MSSPLPKFVQEHIDRVNYTIDVVEGGACGTKWWLYIETARPAAVQAFWMITCFDLLDVFRLFFRPVGLARAAKPRGGGGHRGRRGGLGFFRKTARKIPGVKSLQARRLGTASKALWIFDGWTQRILWYWLMIDIGTSFLYNWASLIRKTEACQQGHQQGEALFTGTGQVIGGIGNLFSVLFTSEYFKNGVTTTPLGFALDNKKWMIIWSAKVRVTAGTSNNTMWLQPQGNLGGGECCPNSNTENPGLNETADLIAVWQGRGSGAFACQIHYDGLTAVIDDFSIAVIERPDIPEPPIKEDCRFFEGTPPVPPVPGFND